MKAMKRYLLCVAVLVVLLAAGLARAVIAGETGVNPGVMPLNAKVAGLDYSQWADRYEQWLNSIPVSADLLADPGAGQDPASPVFFLPTWRALVGEEYSLEGEITVPAGKMLMAPVYGEMGVWLASAMECCGDAALHCERPWAETSCEPTFDNWLACIRAGLDYWVPIDATGLYASVDGQPVENPEQYRFRSAAPISVDFPSDNLWADSDCGMGAFTSYVVSDGYWLWLKPLPVGEHVLQFGSDLGDTTLYVTVAPQ